jgi:hypothetical protein
MIHLDPSFVSAWLQAHGYVADTLGETFAYVATLPLDGARGGWLELTFPESAVRSAAARLHGVSVQEVDDAAAFDGATALFEELRASLPAGRACGEPTIALRSVRAGRSPGAARIQGNAWGLAA